MLFLHLIGLDNGYAFAFFIVKNISVTQFSVKWKEISFEMGLIFLVKNTEGS